MINILSFDKFDSDYSQDLVASTVFNKSEIEDGIIFWILKILTHFKN